MSVIDFSKHGQVPNSEKRKDRICSSSSSLVLSVCLSVFSSFSFSMLLLKDPQKPCLVIAS